MRTKTKNMLPEERLLNLIKQEKELKDYNANTAHLTANPSDKPNEETKPVWVIKRRSSWVFVLLLLFFFGISVYFKLIDINFYISEYYKLSNIEKSIPDIVETAVEKKISEKQKELNLNDLVKNTEPLQIPVQPVQVNIPADIKIPEPIQSRDTVLPFVRETEEVKYNIVTPPKNLSLIGVIDGATPSAIILDNDTSQTQTVELGDEFLGFTVDKIEKGQVSFINGNDKFTIRL